MKNTKIFAIFASVALIISLCSCSGSKQSAENVTQTTTVVPTQQVTTIQEPTDEEPTTAEITTAAESSKWKDSYKDYINGIESSSGNEEFDLLDLDNDGIPELIFDSSFDLGGGTLSSFYQDSINTIAIGSGGITCWNNCVCSVSGRQGMYSTKVFEINHGAIQCVFDGKQQAQNWNFDMNNPDDFTYSYCNDGTENYQSVSYYEYSRAFSNVFDSDSAESISGQFDKASIINAIEAY